MTINGFVNAMENIADLPDQSLELLLKIVSNKGKLKINRQIHYKINLLCQKYGFEFDEVINLFVELYLSKKMFEKYTFENAFSTFIVHCVNYTLNGLLRKCDTHRRHFHEISLEKIIRDSTGNLDEVSLDFLDRINATGLVDFTTPEDMLIGKELLGLMIKHYGRENVLVLLGYEDRQAAADRLGMQYESFCKRLSRKTLLFLPVLNQAGY